MKSNATQQSKRQKAIQEYEFQFGQMADDETKKAWARPKELTYSNSMADEMQVACGIWIVRRCGVVARYQEYVISFDATMDQEMGYAEFEKIVIYIDEQISSRLYP